MSQALAFDRATPGTICADDPSQRSGCVVRQTTFRLLADHVLLPWVGAILGLVIYFVLRGGLLAGEGTVSNTNPFGFAALASMAGLFSEKVMEKLSQRFQGLLSPAPRGLDHVEPK